MTRRFLRRPRLRRTVFLLGWVAAGYLLIAACGDSEGTTEPSATSSPPISAAPTSAAPTSAAPTSPAPTSVSSTTSTGPAATVTVFFSTGDGTDCSEVSGFERSLSQQGDPVRGALEALVAGPTAEEAAAGAGSVFSEDTEGVLASITRLDDVLIVDFDEGLSEANNASSSCGSEALLAQLNATAFGFAEIDRVRYQLAGSCDRFGNWLQRDCVGFDRAGQYSVDLIDRADGSGCTADPGALADGRWFGFIVDAGPNSIDFDLSCWFSGSAASEFAARQGDEAPNGYFVTGAGTGVRTLSVAAGVQVQALVDPGGPALAEVDYLQWREGRAGQVSPPGVWVEVQSGAVATLHEQYTP